MSDNHVDRLAARMGAKFVDADWVTQEPCPGSVPHYSDMVHGMDWCVYSGRGCANAKSGTCRGGHHQAAQAAQPPHSDATIAALRLIVGDNINDQTEARARFLEEAHELAQAAGASLEEVEWSAREVFARPADPVALEVGQVRTALRRLSYAFGVDEDAEARKDREHIERNADAIRERHARKPRFAQAAQPAPSEDVVEAMARAIFDATDPLSGDDIATVIHMSEHLFWDDRLPGSNDLERQLEAVRVICRAAAQAALTASRPIIERDAYERAAKVAEDAARTLRAQGSLDADVRFPAAADTADELAAAIRSLAKEGGR